MYRVRAEGLGLNAPKKQTAAGLFDFRRPFDPGGPFNLQDYVHADRGMRGLHGISGPVAMPKGDGAGPNGVSIHGRRQRLRFLGFRNDRLDRLRTKRAKECSSSRDTLMERVWFGLGSVYCFAGVALGAFAAHGLRNRIDTSALAIFETGVRYQMYHGLALLAVAWAATRWPHPATTIAGSSFAIGTLIFSGTLYLLAITGLRWLGAITPLGGVALLIGWLSLLVSVIRS
jgi:uncharacterized membrane protein YgdD (TMEM256/DUF423 family)